MRVRISANTPLPPVKAWLPVCPESTPTISSFKAILSTALPAFRGHALHLSIDGFDLLDNSEISVLRDGDLVCVDATARDNAEKAAAQVSQKRLEPGASCKRKRRMSSSGLSSSTSEIESESESESETSDTDSESDSEDSSSRPATPSLRKAEPAKTHVSVAPSIQPKPHVVQLSTFVPPGCGKARTRSRNLRRQLKRMRRREAPHVPMDGPVSGANAVVAGGSGQVPGIHEGSRESHTLLSLSLRNKNKAKNFKSLMSRPLPPKIVFGDEEGDACGVPAPDGLGVSQTPAFLRLIAPSSRPSLPSNMFVTSVDVEAGLVRVKGKGKMDIECGDVLKGDVSVEMDVDVDRLELIADKQWDTLEKLTAEKPVKPGTIVGYKGLGINPVTHTPEELVTVASVVSCAGEVVVRRLRGVSFSGPVDGPGEAEGYGWDEIVDGDWRIIPVSTDDAARFGRVAHGGCVLDQ